jgi:hypothetical protein
VKGRFGGAFTSLEPLALIAGTLLATLLARRPGRTRVVAAGLLTGFGVAGSIKAVTTLWWISEQGFSAGPSAWVLLIAALLAVAAGLDLRSAAGETTDRVGGWTLGATAVGAALLAVAVRIPHRVEDGQAAWVLRKQWHELAYEPLALAVVAVAVVILAMRTRRPVFAGGVLMALGVAGLCFWAWFAGVPTAQWALGKSVQPRAGGFVGMAGALLLLVVGRRLATPLMPARRPRA